MENKKSYTATKTPRSRKSSNSNKHKRMKEFPKATQQSRKNILKEVK
jgi:hypothetical protein